MSHDGRPPGSDGVVGDSEWIDHVLDRAGDRASAARPPIVPDGVSAVTPVEPRRDETAQMPMVPRVGNPGGATQSAPTAAPASRPTAPVRDQLADIRWVDTPPVTPASEPIAPQPPSLQPAAQPRPQVQPTRPAVAASAPGPLTPEAVGRSAWDDDLRQLGSSEPEGWDKLSWQDLDQDRPPQASAVPEPGPAVQLIREWGPVLIAAVVIALFTRLVLVQAYHIPSLSMAPTLQEGDRVIVNRLSYNFGEIERGQVVVFSTPPNQPSDANDLIKRVIALPGETIQFRDGDVFVDGLLVQEPYLAQQQSTRPRTFDIPGCAGEARAPDSCTIPEGFVFVMGDNRTGSQDSRTFGPVPSDTIVGRAMLRVWPLADIGQL